MKKILAFAGSNSSTSINHTLINYVASTIDSGEVKVIKLTDYEVPIYSEDLEKEVGFSAPLKALLEEIKAADGILISVNEHNGTVSSFFKNILDWLTRIDYNFIAKKKVLLMSTSPGKRGGLTALEYLGGFLPRIKADVVASIPFPSFFDNFSKEENKIVDQELQASIEKAVSTLVDAL